MLALRQPTLDCNKDEGCLVNIDRQKGLTAYFTVMVEKDPVGKGTVDLENVSMG